MNYLDWQFTWEKGRELKSASYYSTNIQFTYDGSGRRIEKNVNGSVSEYIYCGNKLIQENSSHYGSLQYTYDEEGRPYSITWYGKTVYYVLNLQGDVIRLVDENGRIEAEYVYDAWGNVVYSFDVNGFGTMNPFRYRGYYYDEDLGLYYLNSRYYNPGIGRFINADGYVSTGQGFLGHNMFAYCGNNPVNHRDSTGKYAEALFEEWVPSMWGLIFVDGPLPIGDLIYGGVLMIGGVLALDNISENHVKKRTKKSNEKKNDDRSIVKPGQQPTKEDGYFAPKGGAIKGKTRDGKVGWKDKKGNIWVPQPTGSNGAHGGGHGNRYKERISGGDNHLGNLGFHQQIQAQIQIGSFRLAVRIGQGHCSAAVGSNIGFQSVLDSGGVGFQLGRQGIDQNVTLEVIFVGIQIVSIGIPLFSAFQTQSLQEVGTLGFVNTIENFHMAGSIPLCCRLGELNNISNPKIAELDSLNSIAVADFPITKIGLIGAAQNIVHAFFIIAARRC